MKTAFTTFAIVSLVAVSSASADHDHQRRPARPIDLAHALHVQAQTLEHEFELHYPNAQGARQRTYIITQLAVSTERDLANGNAFGVWKNLAYMNQMLQEVDGFLRQSIANGRPDGPHIRKQLNEMGALAQSIEHSLTQPGGAHRGHGRFGGGRFGGGPVGHDDHAHGGRDRHDDHAHGGRDRHDDHAHGGRDRHDDHAHGVRDRHDDHDHGGRSGLRSNDQVISLPGVISIYRGGPNFDGRRH